MVWCCWSVAPRICKSLFVFSIHSSSGSCTIYLEAQRSCFVVNSTSGGLVVNVISFSHSYAESRQQM